MRDIDILSLLNTPDAYTRFSPFLKDYLVGKETFQIIKDLSSWYENSSDELDWDKFSSWFLVTKHPTYSPDKAEVFTKIFEKLSEKAVDESLRDILLEGLVTRDFGTKVAEIALGLAEGAEDASIEQVYEAVSDFELELNKASDIDKWIVSNEIEDIIETTSGKGLDWRLEELNTSVGPLRKGDFVVVTARPDSGKTSFLASEGSFMAPQLEEDEYVLWFNLEEGGSKVNGRILSAITGMADYEYKADPLKAKALRDTAMNGNMNIKLIDNSSLRITDVPAIFKRYKPGLIIIDQLWKIHGFEKRSSTDTDRITKLYNWGRELAKEYAPVVTVHQADATAEGQLWIDMGQLYMTKVGGPGEADALIGIGRSWEAGWENKRGIFVSKNKMSTPGDRTKRNAKWIVEIEPEIARFKSLNDEFTA